MPYLKKQKTKNYGINTVCIRRGEQLVIPDSDTIVFANDILLVVGESKQMDKFEKQIGLKK